MRRFFCAEIGPTSSLSPETTHHLQRVLRIEPGSEVVLFNSMQWCRAKLEQYENGCAQLSLIGEIETAAERSNHLQLICALPKQQRLSTMIEKIAEVGCDSFTPLYASRSAVKLHPDKIEDRLQRWERIALSATTQSKQCQSTSFERPVELKNIAAEPDTLSLIFTTEGNSRPLAEVLNQSDQSSIRAIIGPEGGFAHEEIEHCKERGCIPVHLPLPVLRIETAAIIATACIKMHPQT